MKKKRIEGRTHLMLEVGLGESTLCGIAFDLDGYDEKEVEVARVREITCDDCHSAMINIRRLKA